MVLTEISKVEKAGQLECPSCGDKVTELRLNDRIVFTDRPRSRSIAEILKGTGI